MHTHDCFAALVYNHFAKSCLAFVLCHKTTRIGHRQTMYLVWHKWFIGGHRWSKIALLDVIEIFLCESHTCNLRVGINYARNSVIGNALQWQEFEHTTYCHLCLTTSHMGEHNLTCHITCSINIL